MGEAKGVERWGILVGADVDMVEEVEMSALIFWHVTGTRYVAIWPVTVPVLIHSRETLGSSNTSSSRGTFSKSGKKGPRGRGRGRQVRFGGLNVLYDEDGNSYPVDDAGQLYIPLEFAQDAGDGEVEVEKQNPTKN